MPPSEHSAHPMLSRVVGLVNRARLGFPRHYFQGTGGIGDDLMCTTVFHELRRRGARRIAVGTQHPSLFWNNPNVDQIIWHRRPRWNRWLREGLPFLRLAYAHYDPATDRDEPLAEHVLVSMCRLAGLTGSVSLRPYLFSTSSEMERGRFGEEQVVIQSSGRAAAHFMQNKEWHPVRFQEVCDALREKYTVIQIGSELDPPLHGAVDLRGKTSLRESAAVLANSVIFIGLVGFLMHLARAVDCRSVIVYGGRERPRQTGYVANANLIGDTPCSPCWLRNRCEYGRACMDMISVEQVLAAAQEAILKHPQPLEVETVEI